MYGREVESGQICLNVTAQVLGWVRLQ